MDAMFETYECSCGQVISVWNADSDEIECNNCGSSMDKQSTELLIPEEYLGEYKKSGGYTKTAPREWTEKESSWMLEQKEKGHSIKEIATALDRSEVSVQIKLKRLTKIGDSYNAANRDLKYSANEKFANHILPKTVLDVYAGNSWWQANNFETVTNDTDDKFETTYSMDALALMCQMVIDRQKFDIIDLDPYGSAYDQFDLAIKLAKKGLVVSFGEWGHKRWKRMDFVKPRYGINSVDDYGSGEKFIAEIQRIAACNKKSAKVYQSIQYSNFLRVYFELQDLKITEQWEEKGESDAV